MQIMAPNRETSAMILPTLGLQVDPKSFPLIVTATAMSKKS